MTRTVAQCVPLLWLAASEASFAADPPAAARGRDHNPYGFAVWLAGGGVKGGKIIGATDDIGLHAAEDKVHVHDLHATLLSLLGIDHQRLTYFFQGRDFRLTDVGGQTISRPGW